jgi:ribonuclease BN (tRNA processing enzyme)
MARRLSIAVLGYACVMDVDASPRILVDPGSGTLDRLEQSCFDLSSLEQILLTRLHINLTADLPAVLTRLYQSGRNRPIALIGPTGEPGAVEFVRLLFGSNGAWRYVNGFDGFDVIARETPSATSNLAAYSIPIGAILEELDVSLYAVAVPDGLLPAVAFRVECGDESVVFSGGISRSTRSFIALAADCGTLVVDGTLEPGAIEETAAKCRAKEVLRTAKAALATPE